VTRCLHLVGSTTRFVIRKQRGGREVQLWVLESPWPAWARKRWIYLGSGVLFQGCPKVFVFVPSDCFEDARFGRRDLIGRFAAALAVG
jgi:hypothetical protein